MIKGTFPIQRFKEIETPFYYYDTKVLRETLNTIREELRHNPNYEMHYAIKANANPKILRIISAAGFGADCVSGGEVRAAIEAGFPASKVVFAGVGKSDREINQALDYGIHCFNVESEAELLIINELAAQKDKVARIAYKGVYAFIKGDLLKGLKFGLLAMIPFSLMTVLLIVEMYVKDPTTALVLRSSFRILNFNLVIFINSFMSPDEVTWAGVGLMNLFYLVIPALSAGAYILGFNRISLYEKLVYKYKGSDNQNKKSSR